MFAETGGRGVSQKGCAVYGAFPGTQVRARQLEGAVVLACLVCVGQIARGFLLVACSSRHAAEGSSTVVVCM